MDYQITIAITMQASEDMIQPGEKCDASLQDVKWAQNFKLDELKAEQQASNDHLKDLP